MGAIAWLVLAAVFGVNWIAAGPEPSPYAVSFSDSESCSDPPDLILDTETGEPLVCRPAGAVVPYPSDPDFGVFTEDDVDKVTTMSESLASAGGLSAADKRAIEKAVHDIGVRNGYEAPRHPHPEDGPRAVGCLAAAAVMGLLYVLGQAWTTARGDGQ
ncbi:hypothetical protein [Streptomyces sp. NL15-2K]|uniref:hypothetical protein n=1 Tax=Streptomyces sp. NL15-2K TaxID=376149 RepID=UPI000F58E437|nr:MULTISPECIES: hypothetical protein [Actinomycetes]WKX13173.1 hypothetical protein Q4V64_38875 [Kutzneria buriramensis]GCB45489.1 hypothetical protein SNL152K_2779 [Streptomyces sp. NL15-2K]